LPFVAAAEAVECFDPGWCKLHYSPVAKHWVAEPPKRRMGAQ
jgi:hypothetical protein